MPARPQAGPGDRPTARGHKPPLRSPAACGPGLSVDRSPRKRGGIGEPIEWP